MQRDMLETAQADLAEVAEHRDALLAEVAEHRDALALLPQSMSGAEEIAHHREALYHAQAELEQVTQHRDELLHNQAQQHFQFDMEEMARERDDALRCLTEFEEEMARERDDAIRRLTELEEDLARERGDALRRLTEFEAVANSANDQPLADNERAELETLLLQAQSDFVTVCQERDIAMQKLREQGDGSPANHHARLSGQVQSPSSQQQLAKGAELERLLYEARSALQDVLQDRDKLAQALAASQDRETSHLELQHTLDMERKALRQAVDNAERMAQAARDENDSQSCRAQMLEQENQQKIQSVESVFLKASMASQEELQSLRAQLSSMEFQSQAQGAGSPNTTSPVSASYLLSRILPRDAAQRTPIPSARGIISYPMEPGRLVEAKPASPSLVTSFTAAPSPSSTYMNAAPSSSNLSPISQASISAQHTQFISMPARVAPDWNSPLRGDARSPSIMASMPPALTTSGRSWPSVLGPPTSSSYVPQPSPAMSMPPGSSASLQPSTRDAYAPTGGDFCLHEPQQQQQQQQQPQKYVTESYGRRSYG